MYYTYILLSKADNHFYVGISSNLKQRLDEHKNGKVKATKNRRPLILIYYECCLNKKDAIKREQYLKSGFGRRFIKNRLENYLTQARDGGRTN
ncbi:MAG: excinuclease ABC subunit C [Candidatus Yanofskybacteria bacterium CG10_big_fil_rev_8_21_14_0_10_36_16]|uniref:Excinuclease ABC subunit C n=1 Tax=Candidatus Yanofskybacteria bacterium CG10_big_fil_rev_8_21_14_0_10_36_16 TaxID=1975096 RepID=A0A2J0Q9A3_9BACT|nr:MAG: excinuclease ABC subunit C [Candidatus Yanofskybacteria bacterium CG10_big_fil_rev_8_21_14_0_10_36_16]